MRKRESVLKGPRGIVRIEVTQDARGYSLQLCRGGLLEESLEDLNETEAHEVMRLLQQVVGGEARTVNAPHAPDFRAAESEIDALESQR